MQPGDVKWQAAGEVQCNVPLRLAREVYGSRHRAGDRGVLPTWLGSGLGLGLGSGLGPGLGLGLGLGWG